MSFLQQIAFYQNRRDEIPNQELAKILASLKDWEGIREIAEHLWDKNPSVSSDCMKVLYEIGYLNPAMIQEYVGDFIKLLQAKNNRMVWGAMIGLSTIATLVPEKVWEHIDLLLKVVEKGSVITQVSGIRTFARLCTANEVYKERLIPILFHYTETCRPVDLATRVETLIPAVTTPQDKELFLMIIDRKRRDLKPAQLKSLNAILRKWEKKG